MSYRSNLALFLTQELEPVLDCVYFLQKKTSYIQTYNIKNAVDNTYDSNHFYNPIQLDMAYLTLLEDFVLLSHEKENIKPQPPSSFQEHIPPLFSLAFSHKWMVWDTVIDEVFYSLGKKFKMKLDLIRQGDEKADFQILPNNQEHLLIKQKVVLNKENGKHIITLSEHNGFNVYKNKTITKKTNQVKHLFLSTLLPEKKLEKIIQWHDLVQLDDFFNTIYQQSSLIQKNKFKRVIKETLKNEYLIFKDSTSKLAFLDLLSVIIGNGICVNNQYTKLSLHKIFNIEKNQLEILHLKNTILKTNKATPQTSYKVKTL